MDVRHPRKGEGAVFVSWMSWNNEEMGLEKWKHHLYFLCNALRDLVPFVQFKKRGKNTWRSATFSKVAGFN